MTSSYALKQACKACLNTCRDLYAGRENNLVPFSSRQEFFLQHHLLEHLIVSVAVQPIERAQQYSSMTG